MPTNPVQAKLSLNYFLLVFVLSVPFLLFGGSKLPLPMNLPVSALMIVPALDIDLSENWATLAPELLWPLWGVALGTATLAYYYRRRGRCPHCGRG